MSHSQFHCTGRAYLDMHGLIFETSICYWQDQPGRGRTSAAASDRRRGRARRGGTTTTTTTAERAREGKREARRANLDHPPPRDRRQPPTPPTTASHRPSPAGLAGTPARREERRGGAVDRTRRTRVRHPHPRRWLQRGHPRGSGNGGGPADPTRSPGSTRRSRDTRPPQHHAVQGPGEARTRARERPRDGGGRTRAPPAAAKAQRRHPRGPLAVTRGRGREPERGAGRDRDPPAATRPPPTSARRARPPSRSRRGVGVEGRGPLPAPPTPAGGGGTPRRRRRRRPTPRRDRVGPRPTSRRAPAHATRGNTRPSERGGSVAGTITVGRPRGNGTAPQHGDRSRDGPTPAPPRGGQRYTPEKPNPTRVRGAGSHGTAARRRRRDRQARRSSPAGQNTARSGGIAGHARGRPGDVPRAHRPGTSGHATREAFSPPAPPTWARWQPPPR